MSTNKLITKPKRGNMLDSGLQGALCGLQSAKAGGKTTIFFSGPETDQL